MERQIKKLAASNWGSKIHSFGQQNCYFWAATSLFFRAAGIIYYGQPNFFFGSTFNNLNS
jgi:hypothetical protein